MAELSEARTLRHDEGEHAATGSERAAVLAARRARRATKKAARQAGAPAVATRTVPRGVLDFLARVELTAVAREISPHAAAATAFDAAVAARKKTRQAANRGTHQLQIESLAALMARRGLLGAGVRVVELGAGKGLLGAVLRDAGLVALEPVALDRRACAGNYDAPGAFRVVADLDAVDVGDALAGVAGRPLLVAKHLCGAASDAAVRAAARAKRPLVLAPCCHPQMTWDAYAGRAWLEARGLGRADFGALLDVVSAAKYARVEEAVRLTTDGPPHALLSGARTASLWRVGRLARRALEEGRANALRDAGFAVAVVEYAPVSKTKYS